MKKVFQFGGVLLTVGDDASFGVSCSTPEAMEILRANLAYVDVGGGRAREGDDHGGRGTGIQGCDGGYCR
jgi:hypothetical protein